MTNKMEPYTRKLLYIILASFVKSPNIDNHGAIYVCCCCCCKNIPKAEKKFVQTKN